MDIAFLVAFTSGLVATFFLTEALLQGCGFDHSLQTILNYTNVDNRITGAISTVEPSVSVISDSEKI